MSVPSATLQKQAESETQALTIEDINLSLQVRKVDAETVCDYAAVLKRGEELPHVDVAFDKTTNAFFLFNGFHRLEAHKENKKTEITA
jgi:uncharacterized ParB-like nuclease family protein